MTLMLVYQTNINVMQLMQCRKAVSENQSTDDRGSFPFPFPWADLAGEWRLVVACGQLESCGSSRVDVTIVNK